MTEEDFWESTPRKIIALIDQKNIIEKINIKNQAIYIVGFVAGIDPDEFEDDKQRLIPGIDIPVDQSLVDRLI